MKTLGKTSEVLQNDVAVLGSDGEGVGYPGKLKAKYFRQDLYGNETVLQAMGIGVGHDDAFNDYLETLAGSWPTIGIGLTESTEDEITTAWVEADRIFTVGNGWGADNRHDALTIYKSGYGVFTNAIVPGAYDHFAEASSNIIPLDGTIQYTDADRLEVWYNEDWRKIAFTSEIYSTFISLTDTPATYPADTAGRFTRHFGAGLVFSTYLGDGDGAWALDPFSRTDTPVVFGEGEAILQLGIYYLLTVTVADRTVGSITILADTTELATITTNGTHEVAFLSTWDNVTVVFSSTENDGFDGDLTFDNLKSVALTNPTGLRLFEANHIDVAGGLYWHNQNFAFAKLPTNFFGSGNLYWGDQSAVDLNEVNKLRVSDIITGDLTTGDLVFKSNLTFHAGTAYDVTFPAAGALVAGRFPYVSKTTPGAELSWSVYSFPVTLPGASSVPLISDAGVGSWLTESSIAKLSGLTSGYVPFYNGTALANSGLFWDAINSEFELTGNQVLTKTTNASKFGIIYKGSTPFIHDFNYGNNGSVTTVGYNTCIGLYAGNLTMGSTATQTYHSSYNNFIGAAAGYSNTTGYSNNFVGYAAGYSNTTGYSNNFVGQAAGYSNTTGYNNNFLGYAAGRYIADGITGRTTGNNGVYVGNLTKASANGTDNEIVIGYNATGLGSNTVVLGNSSVITTALRGNVGIGTTIPTARLHIAAGTATAGTSPLKFTSGTLLTAPEAGAVEFLTDAYYATITTGTARKTFAFLESPVFTGTVETPAIKITTGTSAGYFLTSAADGAASWAAINQMVYPGAGLAVSTGSAWGTSIADNSINWNSAYGWGNHASAGYWVTPTGTNGDILYYNSGWQKLAKGTDGHFLKLANGIPSWAAVNESKWTAGSGNIYHVGDVAIGTSSANPGALAIFGENGNFYTQGDYTTHSKHTASVNPLLYISDETETSPQPLISMLTKNSGSWIVCAKGATTPFELYNAGNFKAAGLTYPSTDGTANQVLKTDGSGTLSWATIAASPWTADTYGIYYNSNVGIRTNSTSSQALTINYRNGIYAESTATNSGDAAIYVKQNSTLGYGFYGILGANTDIIRLNGSTYNGHTIYSKGSYAGGYFETTSGGTPLEVKAPASVAYAFEATGSGFGINSVKGYCVDGSIVINSTRIANFVSLKIGGTERISSAGVFTPSNGVSGSWTTVDGKTITATNGIITAIV